MGALYAQLLDETKLRLHGRYLAHVLRGIGQAMGLEIVPYETCMAIRREKADERTAEQILKGLIKETDRLLLRKEETHESVYPLREAHAGRERV